MPAGGLAACAAAGPFWREKKVTPSTPARGASLRELVQGSELVPRMIWIAGPYQAYPRRRAAKPYGPGPRLGGINIDVGDLSWDGHQFRPENVWQTEQRTPPGEIRQVRAAGDYLFHARQTGEQTVQLRLHLKHYAPAARGHQRGEANELQRIAKTLFRLDQDFAPLKWFTAPPPLRKSSLKEGEVRCAPAPLVFAPTGG